MSGETPANVVPLKSRNPASHERMLFACHTCDSRKFKIIREMVNGEMSPPTVECANCESWMNMTVEDNNG